MHYLHTCRYTVNTHGYAHGSTNVYTHVDTHVDAHVYTHVYTHVYRHVCAQAAIEVVIAKCVDARAVLAGAEARLATLAAAEPSADDESEVGHGP